MSFVVCALILSGCSSAEPKGPNHACFRALDCEEGLVCVEGRCTDDIAPIVPEGAGTPAVPANAPPPGAAGDAGP
ncbi:MAG TPA: hypothetical protein VNN80_01065 [Polyangiaceae bacterium]|nr:hypothetical protein [Polyangiaceae bacterium]